MAENGILDIRGLIRNEYGENVFQDLLQSFGEDRMSSLRVNTLKSSAEEVRSFLEGEGIPFETVPWYEDALCFEKAYEAGIRETELYRDGKIYLQSLSSMIPVLVMKPEEKESILDMCAAPGGKTCQIAALTSNRAQVTACEQQFKRAERLRYNLSLQGARSVLVMNTDARKLDDLFRFDRILVDAPCSGTGTFRDEAELDKHGTGFFSRLLDTQKKLLDKAVRLLKPGGILIYSTCSILMEENEMAVGSVLRHRDMELIPVDMEDLRGPEFLKNGMEGTVTICPDRRYEGFFVAKLRKKVQ